MKTIMILDMSYTLSMFRERQLEQALESRKLEGYFSKVISVHPLAGIFDSGNARFGGPVITVIDDSHVFVEGKVGISWLWRFLPPFNFFLAQAKLVWLLIKMARTSKVDIIRIGDPYYLGLMGLFLARLLKVPLLIRVCFRYDEIYRVTGKPVMPRLFGFRWIEKIVERFVFSRCDLVAGANDDNLRYALENGAIPDFGTVFRYGNLIQACHWVEPKLRVACDDILAEFGLIDEMIIATVARLEPMKCVDDVIRVVAELVRRGHKVKGVVIGDGVLRGECMKLAATLGVEDAVVFVGNRTQDWIARFLPKTKVVVSPHMGRALTEAALAGVPIVAYDYDWQREIVSDGQTGYLVAHNDWKGLADKVEQLLFASGLAMEMGKAVRERVMEMMNPEKLMRHEQDEYSKLLARVNRT